MRTQQQKLEVEKKKLRESLEGAEQRVTKLELNRRSLEGDLQRNQISMNEKEMNCAVGSLILNNKILFYFCLKTLLTT